MDLASLQSFLDGYPGLATVSTGDAELLYVNDTCHPLVKAANADSETNPELVNSVRNEFEAHIKRLQHHGSEHCELSLESSAAANKQIQVIGYKQQISGGQDVYISQFPPASRASVTAPGHDAGLSSSELLNRRNRTLLAISEVTERMIKHQPLDELLQMVAEHLIDLTGASTSFIHLVRPELNKLELVVEVGEHLTPLGVKLNPGEGMAGVAWQSRKASYIEDYNKHPARLKHLAGVKQACALPMVSNGTVFGTLGLMFTQEVESIADLVDLLQQFANLTNVAIQNAKMIEDTRIELLQTKSLTALTEKIIACDTIPALLGVAAHSIIDNYGISVVDAWNLEDGTVRNAIGAWEQSQGKTIAVSDAEVAKLSVSLNRWLEANSALIQSLPSLGLSTMPFFEISTFADNGCSIVALLDRGKPWGLLRLKCANDVLPAGRTQHLLFSVVSQAATATRLLRTLDQAKFKAGHDYLTGLPNRFSFYQKLDQKLASADSHRDRLAVLFIDLDGFKRANDLLGHAQGDQLLIEVSERFSQVLDNNSLLARLGGDEFAVCLFDVDRLTCNVVTQLLLDSLQESFDLIQQTSIGASIGIATFPEHGREARLLIGRADEAMYVAKRNGKNRYQYFSAACSTEQSVFTEKKTALRNVG